MSQILVKGELRFNHSRHCWNFWTLSPNAELPYSIENEVLPEVLKTLPENFRPKATATIGFALCKLVSLDNEESEISEDAERFDGLA